MFVLFKRGFMLWLSVAALAAVCAAAMMMADEDDKDGISDSVTLTIWHVYGSGEAESPFDEFVREFNRTVGAKNDITVRIIAASNSSVIGDAVIASAGGHPGAPNMPDMFVAYPRVIQYIGTEKLLDWREVVPSGHLSLFVGEFIREGSAARPQQSGGESADGLYMLPIAKSTELMFINESALKGALRAFAVNGKPTFDIETGEACDLDRLFAASEAYAEATGKTFLKIEYFFTYFMLTVRSLGGNFIRDGAPDMESPEFVRAFMPLARAAVLGGVCLSDSYASTMWNTADIICNISSSAGVLYFPEVMTHSDNTTEEIVMRAMPYPVFEGARPAMISRGAGLAAMRSDDERRNKAAGVFAQWLTQPGRNAAFTVATGYLPVTSEALGSLISSTRASSGDITEMPMRSGRYAEMYGVIGRMYGTHEFVSLPKYDGFGQDQSDFEKAMKSVLRYARAKYLRLAETERDADAVRDVSEEALARLRSAMKR